ncbi:MAG TPA: serine hydrolase domain-containing protein [Solirubrobacteraceae bacterium]|jgi:CubicO group peptidase (beta-lactamase class C family)|nr:serine hydrolase domain-containing protein [Solirubrobacteraceae bacterium]
MAQAAAVALAGVHNVEINEAALAAHVIAPANLAGVTSSRGLDEGTVHADFAGSPVPTDHFDVAGFGTALHAALKDEVVGYTMRLRQNSTTIYTLEWNWAKTPADGGEGWTPDVRMHIASCSKLVTGIAMTKLLNEKPISYDTPIVAYLPKYWVKGPGVSKITFRQLMTHTSGLEFGVKTSASDYLTMKAAIAAGVPKNGQYWYQNMNFGLCRILLATINGNVAAGANFEVAGIAALNDVTWDYTTIAAYLAYVKAHVFEPAGVTGATTDHPSADALAYEFPATGNGWNSGDLTTMIGGAGWHMSVDELLDIMGTFRRSATIMSATQAQTMLDDGFGIDVRQSTAVGTLYNKNGLWEDGAGHTEQSLAYFLPGNMELVVLANSPIGAAGEFFRTVVTDIYLANIKPSAIIRPPASKLA